MHIFLPQLWKSHFPNERCQFIALPGAFDARHTPYPQDRGNWCKDLRSFASNIIANPILENNCKTKTGTYGILYGLSNLFLKVDNVRWRWPSMKLGWDIHDYSCLLSKLPFAGSCVFLAATYLKALPIKCFCCCYTWRTLNGRFDSHFCWLFLLLY